MKNRRTAIVYVLIGVLFLVVVVWLYNYLAFGTLELSNKGGAVAINKPTVNGISGAQVAQGSFKIKIKLRAGTYIASTGGSTISVSQTVRVKAHSHLRVDVTPRPLTNFEPVLSEAAQNIAVGERIVYLNPTDSKLYQVDSSNNLSQIPSSSVYRNIQWSDSSYGIAQDTNGNLFVVDGTTVRQLAIPAEIKQKQYTQYAVTHSRDIYLAYQGNLYFGRENQQFKKIESNLGPVSLLVNGTHTLAWINDGDTNNKEESAPSIVVVENGKKITKHDIGSFVAAWSPNDGRLAISSQDGGEILDSNLKLVARIPHSSFNNPVWLSNSRLAYSTSGQVWTYDVDSQRSDELGQANSGEIINEIVPSQNGSYIYLGVTGVSGLKSIRRVSLTGAPMAATLSKLTVFLPLTLPECSAGYINFAQLGILLRPYSTSPQNQCLQDAKNTLADDQLDVSSLSFKFGPALP